MTDPHIPNFRALAETAARNYVLRTVEDSRAEDRHGDLDSYPMPEAEHVNHAYHELAEEAAKVTVGFPPDRHLPVVLEDGRVHYCRTIETMDQEQVNAALVALAVEYVWLTHYRTQRVQEFAELLNLRRLKGWLEPDEN